MATITIPNNVLAMLSEAASYIQPIRDVPVDENWTPGEGETWDDRPMEPEYTPTQNTREFFTRWIKRQIKLGLTKKARAEEGAIEVPEVDIAIGG